jgi:hypothetical protein
MLVRSEPLTKVLTLHHEAFKLAVGVPHGNARIAHETAGAGSLHAFTAGNPADSVLFD